MILSSRRYLPSAIVLFFAFSAAVNAEDRSLDGVGNHQMHLDWGAASTSYQRMDANVYYGDSISTPAGEGRPNARLISNTFGHQPSKMPDPRGLSDYTWQWGQFLDHDITLRRGGSEFLPIMTQPDDALAPMIPFSRSAYDPATGTGVGNPREQINDTTAFIDASMVYGTDATRAAALRSFSGGQLKTTANGSLLPYNTTLLPNDNEGSLPGEKLFIAGDPRANEHVGLTAMHTLFVREHNRLADEIAAANPTWDDEQIYQRARRIVGAIVQSITYNEYLPALLGTEAPQTDAATYDPTINPSIENEFAAAAFRLGHTQVSDSLLRMEANGQPSPGGEITLADAFFNPDFFASGAEVDKLLKGLSMQVQQRTDTHMIDTLRNEMFGPAGSGGMDLFAINIERGRDHGLASYNDMRVAMGDSAVTSFSEISSDPSMQAKLQAAYGTVDNIDLWVGTLAEDPLSDAAVGELTADMVAHQFEHLMLGDRFFFLWDEEFTATDRDGIMQTRLSDVILRNTSISQIQPNVFFAVPEPSVSWMVIGLGLWMLNRRIARSRMGNPKR